MQDHFLMKIDFNCIKYLYYFLFTTDIFGHLNMTKKQKYLNAFLYFWIQTCIIYSV